MAVSSPLASTLGARMSAELASQPDSWAKACGLASAFTSLRRPGQRLAIVGCGTSWFVAQAVAALREQGGFGITDAFAASEARLAGRDYDAVLALSRSGTTTEIETLLRSVPTTMRKVVVVADASTPVAVLADEVIELPFADESSVVQTRFASTTIALARAAFGEDLADVVEQARAVLAEPAPRVLVEAEQLTCLGSGWTIGLAHEAALKLRESSQSWTESYPAMEYRHGPMSISSAGRAVWMFGTPPAGLAQEVRRTGAHFEQSSLDPLVELVRAHQVALARSRDRGLDADAPRHLARSVILGQ
ncbi:MAG: SIS domain-containing protein [Propionicimonas sp.]